jgi:hypothetical protein
MTIFEFIEACIVTIIVFAIGDRIIHRVEKQERIRQKAKDGTLEIWDLL